MSNLQLWLAIAGGLVLVIVVAHSSWTSRKNQPRQAQNLVSSEEFEALNGAMPPLEPQLSDDTDLSNADTLGELSLAPKQANLDALIDVIATLELDAPVSGDAAISYTPSTLRVGNKLLIIEGLDAQNGEWESIKAGMRYSAFQVGVQLANRMGPLNEIEFSEFVVKTQTFAEELGTTPEFPDMLEVVTHARELDQFASAHDAQLSFTIKATQTAWSPGYVQQHAARLGFVPGLMPGRMVIASPTAGVPPVLGLTFDTRAALSDDPSQSAIRSITLSLDVPQVPREQQPFENLCKIALELAKIMDGQITDDRGQYLRPEAMQGINADLQILYDALDKRDLSAGSPQARRLFS